MSMESAKSFVSKIVGSERLQIQVGQAIEGKSEQAAAEAFVALGKSNGFEFSTGDALAVRDLAMQQQASGEMSAAELSGVSGGRSGAAAAKTAGPGTGNGLTGPFTPFIVPEQMPKPGPFTPKPFLQSY